MSDQNQAGGGVLERIADALERIEKRLTFLVKHQTGAGAAPADDTAKAAPATSGKGSAKAAPATSGKGKGKGKGAAKGPSLDDVRAAFRDLAEAKGKDAGFALLKEFEVEKVAELDAEQYAAVIERAGAMKAEEDSAAAGDGDDW